VVLTPGSHYDAYTPPFCFLRQEGKRHSSSGQNNLAWSLYPGEIGLPPAFLWGLHESNCRAFFAHEVYASTFLLGLSRRIVIFSYPMQAGLKALLPLSAVR